MFKMNNEITNNATPSSTRNDAADDSGSSGNGKKTGIWARLKYVLSGSNDTSLREALEEYVDKQDEESDRDPVSKQEKELLANTLKIRSMPVSKVMVPRADIVAIDINTDNKDLFALLASKQYSRIPVYEGSLDEVLGTIHLKDIIGAMVKGEKIILKDLLTEIPIVSPFILSSIL